MSEEGMEKIFFPYLSGVGLKDYCIEMETPRFGD